MEINKELMTLTGLIEHFASVSHSIGVQEAMLDMEQGGPEACDIDNLYSQRVSLRSQVFNQIKLLNENCSCEYPAQREINNNYEVLS